MNKVNEELCKFTKEENIFTNEPMSQHTTFKLGGKADYFVKPSDAEELANIIKYARENNMQFYIIGNGSNLLVTDKGFRGIIIQVADSISNIKINGTTVTAQSGIQLKELARMAAKESLTGLEFAEGIPGTLGGAVYMNAGAYDGEMKNVIVSIKVLNEDGSISILSNQELQLSYRHSVLMDKNLIVLEVTMELEEGSQEKIYSKMEEFSFRRRTKQPLEYASAGSTFKRPAGYFAGKLIQDSGLVGYTVGGASISEKHSGFVINKGNATASDVLQLLEDVKVKVKQEFGVDLEAEVRIVGES